MPRRLPELARLFLKLGTISFGGPAAHVAIMEQEVVLRRRWISHEEFADLLGATNLIPGPNAVEMAAHVGYRRAGLAGCIIAGVAFIVPAALITTGLAWAYVRFGSLPEAGWLLRGIKPAVLAIVAGAVWRLGRKTLARWPAAVVAAGVVVAVLLGSDEIITLLAGAAVGSLLFSAAGPRSAPPVDRGRGVVAGCLLGSGLAVAPLAPAAMAATAAAVAPLWKLGLFFLKVGAVMYGTGYVLVAYLEGGLVDKYPGFGRDQLLDAVAVGQLTPGPLLTTATFVGYVLAGLPGAVVATVAIFLPSFVLVAATSPLLPRLRRWPAASRFLDAVNAASVGLMAAVSITLSKTTLHDWQSWLIAAAALALAAVWNIGPAWLVLGGAAAGWVLWQ